MEDVTTCLGKFINISLESAKQGARKKTAPILERGISRIQLERAVEVPPILRNEPLIIVPTPLHPKKLKERGFNQSYLLALFLARNNARWKICNAIHRTKKTAAQASLHGIDRADNIKGAFAFATKPDEIRGKHIIIIDDVITTGSTTNEMALLLKKSYAKSVWALTIAYGHPL